MSGAQVRDNWELGPEKFCPGCEEWWPADREFFYADGFSGLQKKCKACQGQAKTSKQTSTTRQGGAQA